MILYLCIFILVLFVVWCVLDVIVVLKLIIIVLLVVVKLIFVFVIFLVLDNSNFSCIFFWGSCCRVVIIVFIEFCILVFSIKLSFLSFFFWVWIEIVFKLVWCIICDFFFVFVFFLVIVEVFFLFLNILNLLLVWGIFLRLRIFIVKDGLVLFIWLFWLLIIVCIFL